MVGIFPMESVAALSGSPLSRKPLKHQQTKNNYEGSLFNVCQESSGV